MGNWFQVKASLDDSNWRKPLRVVFTSVNVFTGNKSEGYCWWQVFPYWTSHGGDPRWAHGRTSHVPSGHVIITWKTHERGFSTGTRQIFPVRGPFIEIYGESHNDYNYASRNYKMLHLYETFLTYSWKYIIWMLLFYVFFF